jgi:hypothetical protein
MDIWPANGGAEKGGVFLAFCYCTVARAFGDDLQAMPHRHAGSGIVWPSGRPTVQDHKSHNGSGIRVPAHRLPRQVRNRSYALANSGEISHRRFTFDIEVLLYLRTTTIAAQPKSFMHACRKDTLDRDILVDFARLQLGRIGQRLKDQKGNRFHLRRYIRRPAS